MEKDLISTVTHLCIEPRGGEARRKLCRATRRNTEMEKDDEHTFGSFSQCRFEPVKLLWFERQKENELGGRSILRPGTVAPERTAHYVAYKPGGPFKIF